MDLIIVGDVQTVLTGHVTEKSLHPVSLNEMPYALGGAAIPGDALSLGETLVYEGTGHVFTPDKSLVETKTLEAAFLMGIDRKPKDSVQVKNKSISSFYQDLLKNYPNGFAITGTALFSKLFTAYLRLSPIYGENVNTLHDKYWSQEELINCGAHLFGVILSKMDERAFYKNPNEKKSSPLLSHTHVLCPDARHLLTHSEIFSGSFWVEDIDSITHSG